MTPSLMRLQMLYVLVFTVSRSEHSNSHLDISALTHANLLTHGSVQAWFRLHAETGCMLQCQGVNK